MSDTTEMGKTMAALKTADTKARLFVKMDCLDNPSAIRSLSMVLTKKLWNDVIDPFDNAYTAYFSVEAEKKPELLRIIKKSLDDMLVGWWSVQNRKVTIDVYAQLRRMYYLAKEIWNNNGEIKENASDSRLHKNSRLIDEESK